jgi:hypothetical protein
MARTPNPMGRSRQVGSAYVVTEDLRLPGWRWEVLKTYQLDGAQPFARAFCAVSSPMTWGSYDLGDTYTKDIGRLVVGYDSAVFGSPQEAARALWGATAVDGINYAVDLRDPIGIAERRKDAIEQLVKDDRSKFAAELRWYLATVSEDVVSRLPGWVR